MSEHHHLPAMFIADAAGLDFLNSVATPVDEVIDWLATGEGFLDWLGQAGLAPVDLLLETRARSDSGQLDELAKQARELREWFRTFARKRMGRPLAPSALGELKPLNTLLKRGETYLQIVPQEAGSGFSLTNRLHWRSPESLLLPVAESLAELVCNEDFTHVKGCEGRTCTLMFADHTRGRARRWCSMAVCGNRAKQASHRDRLKSGR